MTIIKWRDSYETGVAEMDNEHREIIEIINQLYEMLREKKSYSELENIYNRLLDYTKNHFAHEENLMEEAKYPGLERQRKAHAMFIAELEKMEKDLLSAEESVAPVVYKFLREWLLKHIVEVDKEYGPSLSTDES